MAKATVRLAEKGDGNALAPNLRLADRREVVALSGESALTILENNLWISDKCWTVVLEDEPIAIFGYIEDGDNAANIWMLGSDKINDIRWQFLRESKNWLKKITKDFDRVWAVADIRNKLHTDWYKWLGFGITTTLSAGPYALPFYHIEYQTKEQSCATP